jgi:hypothetical protein
VKFSLSTEKQNSKILKWVILTPYTDTPDITQKPSSAITTETSGVTYKAQIVYKLDDSVSTAGATQHQHIR